MSGATTAPKKFKKQQKQSSIPKFEVGYFGEGFDILTTPVPLKQKDGKEGIIVAVESRFGEIRDIVRLKVLLDGSEIVSETKPPFLCCTTKREVLRALSAASSMPVVIPGMLDLET